MMQQSAAKIRTLLLVSMVLFGLSAVLAMLAFSYPMKSLPVAPPATNRCPGFQPPNGPGSCMTIPTPQYIASLISYENLIWLRLAWEYLAVGLSVSGILCLTATLAAPRVPRGPRVPVPRALRDVALLVAFAALALFSVFAFYSIVATYPGDFPGPFLFAGFLRSHFGDYYLGIYTAMFHGQPTFWASTGLTFGKMGFAVFMLGSTGAFVYWLGDGAVIALGKAIAFFAAPSLVAFELAMLVFAPSQMPVHATMFLGSLSVLITNWFILAVSSGLFAFGLSCRGRTPTLKSPRPVKHA